jgi:cathepsin D
LTNGEDGDESEIALGGYNPKRLLGSLSWAPVVNPDLGYWQLELLAVRVDGKPLDICQDGSCRAVMDTGTSHLGIPSPHDEMLSDLLIRPANGASDCSYVKAPVLEFEFHGFNMTLHPEDYMRKLPLAEGLQVGSTRGVSLDEEAKRPSATKVKALRPLPGHDVSAQTKPYYECRPRLMPVNLPAPMGPKLFILGEPVLHRYYTVFDWMGPQIGFGLANKQRYTDPVKMIEAGELLRDDVKALLSVPTVADELILVQVTFALNRRGMKSVHSKEM